MQIQITTESSFARKVEVTVPADAVRAELDKAFASVARRARLPGFRQGKVPRKLLEARYGAGISEDVAENLIQQGWRRALDDHDLNPVARPALTERGDVSRDGDFRFVIAVEVRPEVSLTTYEGLSVYWPEAEVEDAEVDAALEQQRAGQARLASVEDRAVEAGDQVQVELQIKDGDEVVVSEPGTMIRTGGDAWYPGLEEHLLGLAIDASKTFECTFADDARAEEVAGRTLQVDATVHGISTMVVPELDDDLAKEVGHDSVDAWRESLRGQLAEGREEAARNQARANLLTALIEANAFEVPAAMIAQNLDMLKNEIRNQRARAGQDPQTVTFSETLLADLQQRAVFAAKGALILESVVRTEELAVTDEELDGKFAEFAESMGQTVEQVRSWFATDESKAELRDRLLEEKTLDWLLDKQEITREAPEPAEAPAAEAPAAETPVAETPVAEAAPAEAAPAAAGDADLSILEGSIKDLKAALATGAHDAHLDALIAAEEAGRARKGALSALAGRR